MRKYEIIRKLFFFVISGFSEFFGIQKILFLYPENIRKYEIIQKLFIFVISGFSEFFRIQNLTGTYHMRLELRIRTGSM